MVCKVLYFKAHYVVRLHFLSSCHGNESTWAKAIQNKIFIEANVMNISAVSGSSLLWLLRRFLSFFLFFFFLIYPFSCHGNQTNSAAWIKFICFIEDYSRNISIKLLSKYLQWDSNKCQFPLFHYKSMETISCHNNQSSYLNGTKTTIIHSPCL